MRAEPPPSIAEKYPPGTLAEKAWWLRVNRAAERRGRIGSRLMADWCHAMLKVLGAAEGRVGLYGSRWQPIPPERCTEEYKQAERRRLTDEVGMRLGVGPMP